ncbi:MAG: hypothetical protein IJ622_06480 [Bacteroidales bacterium]|nr:hypothetical protein [Bacteroidales bacterium]
MKKLILTIAIVLGLGMTSFADPNGGGLFQRGNTPEQPNGMREGEGGMVTPGLPGHGQSGNQDAPLGSGIAVLVGLGAAYLVGKRRRED